MILSERSVARPAPASPPPKAICPSCGRPVVLLRAGTCLYCGGATGPAAPALEPASKIPPQVLIQLEPRARTTSTARRWMVRAGAVLAGMSAVILLFVGPCRA